MEKLTVIIPCKDEADNMEEAAAFAGLMKEGMTGISAKLEILELTDENLHLEDEEGNVGKYTRVD